jgi:REP element-mobilizing transposase RayT
MLPTLLLLPAWLVAEIRFGWRLAYPAGMGNAAIHPPYPATISRILKAAKPRSLLVINRGRGEAGELWQRCFFDRAPRTVREYTQTVEYLHLNPVRRGLAKSAED